MDRSRSPRNLSGEARLLQRLAEVELPPGASDAERVAARAEAAAAVEQASNEVGEHWARAYQELHPDWQPTTVLPEELIVAQAQLDLMFPPSPLIEAVHEPRARRFATQGDADRFVEGWGGGERDEAAQVFTRYVFMRAGASNPVGVVYQQLRRRVPPPAPAQRSTS